jgi:sec-independent protein translocase protein TatA
MMFANFGPGHWAVLAIVMIVLFGAKKLPDAARSLGKSMRIFKAELGELHSGGKLENLDAAPNPGPSERVGADSSAAESRSLQPPTELLPLGNRRAQGVNGSAPSA